MNHKRERQLMEVMQKVKEVRNLLTVLQDEELRSVGSINPTFIQRREEFLKAYGAMLNGLNNGIYRIDKLMKGVTVPQRITTVSAKYKEEAKDNGKKHLTAIDEALLTAYNKAKRTLKSSLAGH